MNNKTTIKGTKKVLTLKKNIISISRKESMDADSGPLTTHSLSISISF